MQHSILKTILATNNIPNLNFITNGFLEYRPSFIRELIYSLSAYKEISNLNCKLQRGMGALQEAIHLEITSYLIVT